MDSDLFLVHQSDNGNGVFAARLKIGDQVIGRSSDNEIYLSLDTISRVHARLSVEKTGVIVTDLGSRNGTWINQKRVVCAPVFPGQKIQFGNVAMVLSHDPSGVCGQDEREETRDARNLKVLRPATPIPLPAGQARVLDLLMKGMIEKQVAAQLGISQHTVHNQARKIYDVYGVRSRVELLLKLLPPPKTPD